MMKTFIPFSLLVLTLLIVSEKNLNSDCYYYCTTITAHKVGDFTYSYSTSGQRLCNCAWEFRWFGCPNACCVTYETASICDDIGEGAQCIYGHATQQTGWPEYCNGACHGNGTS